MYLSTVIEAKDHAEAMYASGGPSTIIKHPALSSFRS